MVNVDMNRPDRDLNPGVDLWEVMKSEATNSRAGDAMIRLKLFRVSDPAAHLFDNIMLAGGGWGIGKSKLVALGVSENFRGDLDPLDFVGRRVWVSTGVDSYEGKDRLKVMIDGLRYSGYQPADQVPPGCVAPEPESDRVPF